MITIANFTDRFLIDLVKMLKTYGTLFVTEDGNIYRTKKSAQDRSTNKSKLAVMNREDEQLLRYITVDLNNYPKNIKELKQMFDDQELTQRRERRNEQLPADTPTYLTMSDEEALAALGRDASDASEVTKAAGVVIGGEEYDLEAVKAALKGIDSKFNLRTGLEKTQAAIDALGEEAKSALVATLK